MERQRIRFLYRRDETVTWACAAKKLWVICWRRHTDRGMFGPLVEYGLREIPLTRDGPMLWAYEADIELVKKELHHG